MRGITFIIKPVGDACNLTCDYCYYREGAPEGSVVVMNRAVLSKFISEYLALPQSKAVFIWHGGEPLLAGREFYEEAVHLQRYYQQNGQKIVNRIQTNATLVDGGWANFFKDNQFQVGISLDGPLAIHNDHRRYPSGEGSFASVMEAVSLLKSAGTTFGTLVVLTRSSLGREAEIFQFLVENGVHHFDLRPCALVNRFSRDTPDCSISPREFADSTARIFDLWWELDNPGVHVRLFENILRGILGGEPGLCEFVGACATHFTLDIDGSIYPCDKFAGLGAFRFGNILEAPLAEILASEVYRNFAAQINAANSGCSGCGWLSICGGGCAYYRYMRRGSFTDRNYFCGFRRSFLQHVKERVDQLQERR